MARRPNSKSHDGKFVIPAMGLELNLIKPSNRALPVVELDKFVCNKDSLPLTELVGNVRVQDMLLPIPAKPAVGKNGFIKNGCYPSRSRRG